MKFENSYSFSDSLKGRIWLATSALAFFIVVLGLISYLLVTFFTENAFFGVLVPFLLISITVLVYGLWLAAEVTGPIEKLAATARILEDHPTTTLPKTSGAAETDIVLSHLGRLNQQVTAFSSAVEACRSAQASGGNKKINLSEHLPESVRGFLSDAYQGASQASELSNLRKELDDFVSLAENHSVEYSERDYQTPEIARLRSVWRRTNISLSSLSTVIKNASVENFILVKELKDRVEAFEALSTARTDEVRSSSALLETAPQMVIGVVDELSKSARFIKISIERAKKSSKDARVSLELIKKHRRNLRDIAKRLERLDAIASDIAKNSKKVDDLKNRADMIGLSVSITATELGDKGRGLLSLANEIERLAERTHEASSEIEENHKKVRAEIKKIETALRTSTLETSDLSVFPIEAGNALAEFEKNLTGFLSLQNDMLASNREHKERISDAFNGLANAVSGYEADYAPLKESDGLFSQVLQSMELLYETATQNNNEASKTTVNLTDTNLDNGRSATGWEIGANQ